MHDLEHKTISEMLAIHVTIMEELRSRGVLRSANNPTGDLAEYLFCSAFGWHQAPNSEKGLDAKDGDGTRYQIKGRRLHRHSKTRQLSAIRSLDAFDVLAALLFDDYYRITRAALIPAAVVRERVTYSRHTNSHLFMLCDDVWTEPEVIDVTDQLRAVENA